MSGVNESSDGPAGPPPAPELPAPSPVPVMPPQELLPVPETGSPQDSPTESAATEPSPAAASSNAEADQQVVAEMSAPLTSATSTSTSTSTSNTAQAQAPPLAVSPEPEPTAPEAPAEAPSVAAEIAAVPAPAPSPLPVLVADQSSDLSGHSVRTLPTPPASARSIGPEQLQLTVVLTADEGRAADAPPPSSLTIKTLRYPNGIVKRVMSPKSPRSRERSATRTPLSVSPRRSAREFSPVPPQLSTRPLSQSRAPESRAAAATKPVEFDASSTAQSIAPRPVNYVFAPWCAVGKAVRRMYSAPVDMRRPALIAVGRALRGPPPPLPVQVAAANAENSNDGYSYEMADARSSTVHSAPLQRRRMNTSYASSYSNRGYSTPASDFRSAVTELLIEEDFEVAETDYERHVDAIVQRLGRPTISSARMLPASVPADARARGVAGGGCLSAYLSPIRRRERDAAPTPATLPEASRAQSSSSISYAASDNSQMPPVSLGASDECRSAVTVSSRSASGTPFWCERSQPGLARSGREERPYLYGGELVWARMPFIDAHRSYLWQRDGALSRPRSAASART